VASFVIRTLSPRTLLLALSKLIMAVIIRSLRAFRLCPKDSFGSTLEFLSPDGHILWRRDTEPNVVSMDRHHRQPDIITDDNFFTELATQN
jgi:hypothetical protein